MCVVCVLFQLWTSLSRTESAEAWNRASSSTLNGWRERVNSTWREIWALTALTSLASCCSLALSASFQAVSSPGKICRRARRVSFRKVGWGRGGGGGGEKGAHLVEVLGAVGDEACGCSSALHTRAGQARGDAPVAERCERPRCPTKGDPGQLALVRLERARKETHLVSPRPARLGERLERVGGVLQAKCESRSARGRVGKRDGGRTEAVGVVGVCWVDPSALSAIVAVIEPLNELMKEEGGRRELGIRPRRRPSLSSSRSPTEASSPAFRALRAIPA